MYLLIIVYLPTLHLLLQQRTTKYYRHPLFETITINKTTRRDSYSHHRRHAHCGGRAHTTDVWHNELYSRIDIPQFTLWSSVNKQQQQQQFKLPCLVKRLPGIPFSVKRSTWPNDVPPQKKKKVKTNPGLYYAARNTKKTTKGTTTRSNPTVGRGLDQQQQRTRITTRVTGARSRETNNRRSHHPQAITLRKVGL